MYPGKQRVELHRMSQVFLPRQMVKPYPHDSQQLSTFATPLDLTGFEQEQKKKLTPIIILIHKPLHSAGIRLIEALCRQPTTGWTKAAIVHSVLERVVFPAKDVIAVLAVSSARQSLSAFHDSYLKWDTSNLRITSAENKWLRAIHWPVFLTIEGCGVPDDLRMC